MPSYKKYIFICENMRDPSNPKGCCGLKGGAELKKVLKQKLISKKLHKIFRANSAGCLDLCAHGAALVIYPQGIFYGNVNNDDLDEIIENSLLKDQTIDRLLIKESE